MKMKDFTGLNGVTLAVVWALNLAGAAFAIYLYLGGR